MNRINWPLCLSGELTPTGLVTAIPGQLKMPNGAASPVAPGATVPSGPASRARNASTSVHVPALIIQGIETSLSQQRAPLSLPIGGDETRTSAGRDPDCQGFASWSRSSPGLLNKVGSPLEFQVSTSASSDGDSKRNRKPAFSMLHPRKWARLKSTMGKKRKKSKSTGMVCARPTTSQIPPPDSTVACRSIGGYRPITISIPVEYGHLGTSNNPHYPIYPPGHPHHKGDGHAKANRSWQDATAPVAVLRPVTEDMASVPPSIMPGQVHHIASIDIMAEAIPPGPPPRQETFGQSDEPEQENSQSPPIVPDTANLVNTADDSAIHRPESKASDKPDSGQDQNVVWRIYVPRTGDRQAKEPENQPAIRVPCSQNSSNHQPGPVAEAFAALSGLSTPAADRLSGGNLPQPDMAVNGQRSEPPTRVKEVANDDAVVACSKPTRSRPPAILLEAPNNPTSATLKTPPHTPLLTDFPPPPGIQQVFVDSDPSHPESVVTSKIEIQAAPGVGGSSTAVDASKCKPECDAHRAASGRASVRQAKAREKRQRTREALKAHRSQKMDGGTSPKTPKDLPPNSPRFKNGRTSGARKSKIVPSLTPIMVVANVEPSSPPRSHKGHSDIRASRSPAALPVSSPGSPPISPLFPPRDLSRLIRTSASLPLDRIALARVKEFRELRDQQRAASLKSNNSVRTSQMSSTLVLSQDNLIETSGQHPKTSGPPRSPQRGRVSELTNAHDSLIMLPHAELLSRHQALRDRQVEEIERRLRRLEDNGDVWLNSIAPLLKKLNKTIDGLLTKHMNWAAIDISASSGDMMADVGTTEWRSESRVIHGARQGHSTVDEDKSTQHQSDGGVEVEDETSPRPGSSRAAEGQRDVSAAAEVIAGRCSIDLSSKPAMSPMDATTTQQAGAASASTQNDVQESQEPASRDEEDNGKVSQTSGMETLEPLMRELQGAARFSLGITGEMKISAVE